MTSAEDNALRAGLPPEDTAFSISKKKHDKPSVHDQPPETNNILPARFKMRHHPDFTCYAIWDMGDHFQKKKEPEVWALFEYHARTPLDKACRRCVVTVGMLNGTRSTVGADLMETP